jgi:hypothetical protein
MGRNVVHVKNKMNKMFLNFVGEILRYSIQEHEVTLLFPMKDQRMFLHQNISIVTVTRDFPQCV